jgi:hypothetical protein
LDHDIGEWHGKLSFLCPAHRDGATKQADPATAAAIRKFLLWTIVPSETNESYLDNVHFITLPPHIWELSQAQVQTIR